MAVIFDDRFRTLGPVETAIVVSRFDPKNPNHVHIAHFFDRSLGSVIDSSWIFVWVGVFADGDWKFNSFHGNAYEEEKILYLRRGTTGAIDSTRQTRC